MKICYTEMADLLQFTINIRKSHRQPQYTLQLVCEDRVLFVFTLFPFSTQTTSQIVHAAEHCYNDIGLSDISYMSQFGAYLNL